MKISEIRKILLVSAFLAAPAAAQTSGGLPSVGDIISRARSLETPLPLPAAPADDRVQKEWTIMVFMNGKNSLSGYVQSDMNEMEKVGSTDKINIVVEAGRTAYKPPAQTPPPFDDGYPDVNPWGGHPGYPGWHPAPYMSRADGAVTPRLESWTGVRRYYVLKDTDTFSTGSRLLEELPDTDMGDWNQLVQFAQWARAAYPARRYMLIVWNHGDGWMTKGLEGGLSLPKGISYDDETGNGITTVELGQALAKIGGVDVYASDACLMQMQEVVYELKDYAPVIVGSEETEPGDGWDYAAFLSRLNPRALSPEDLAAAAVAGFNASYSAKKEGATLSAVRSGEAEPLRILMDQWADLAMTQDKTVLKDALNASKAFEGVDSRDLLDFMAIAGAKLPALQPKGAEISALVTGRMLIKNGATGDDYKKAYGLGVYLPSYGFDENYAKLALSKAGKWDEFTQWLNK